MPSSNSPTAWPDLPMQREVVEERGSRHSYTVEHSVVKRRDLNRAVRFGDKYVVADGLEAGERLITRGQYRVSPGMKVREAPEGLPDARD